MDARSTLREHWPFLAAALAVLLLLAWLVERPSSEPDANEELARTARTAVEAADRAQRENDAAYLWPGRLRLAVIAIGVGVPIMAAVLLVHLVTRQRPEDAELLEQLEQRGLVLRDRSSRSLAGPDSSPELAADGTEANEPTSVEQAAAPAVEVDKAD